jgi:hypothetical protein
MRGDALGLSANFGMERLFCQQSRDARVGPADAINRRSSPTLHSDHLISISGTTRELS